MKETANIFQYKVGNNANFCSFWGFVKNSIVQSVQLQTFFLTWLWLIYLKTFIKSERYVHFLFINEFNFSKQILDGLMLK